ncbi:hypothetical protein [Pseudomonas nitroreducens]|uniref:Uncharacterized protein n=1 Tax=Pseudomonas nitroreducens TaxID=46680 RepID=A0A6G6IU56_PSENT|nr:hypothetical protein [Pseudomonas nitroreducens]QIE86736.1 hypothetical protein G5B91_10795 [Pseudomonas nitroreducens]
MPDEKMIEEIAGKWRKAAALGCVDALECALREAWQASRAAIKVELPEQKPFWEYYDDIEGGEFNWRKYLTAVDEALQQAGIEVVK